MPLQAKPTQEFVPIKEIKDGIVVLKDNSFRVILLVSSINLALKSLEEQKAIFAQFQAFLNSLDFSVQIVIQSRRYDIRPYLTLLENRLREIEEPLLKIQTKEYIEFIRTFTEQVDIMTKYFFIVIPYTPPVVPIVSGISLPFIGKKEKDTQIVSEEEKIQQLNQRVALVEGGLNSIGLQVTRLGTEEALELFYKTFNPGELAKTVS